ncbi:MAG: ThiF family adenylyltransferase [Negativicutes bacterium]
MGKQESLVLLENGQIPERYKGNVSLIGIAGLIRLLNAKVAIIGAGGLGGTIIELLARQGVGYLRVIDGDFFTTQNLNRQMLATELSLGINKAEAAISRIVIINSDVYAEAVPKMLQEENVQELLAGMDVVVDAVDNIRTRILLSKTAQSMGIPLVHGAIAGFAGQVTTVLPSDKGLENIYRAADASDATIEKMLGNPAATPAFVAAIQAQEVVKLLTAVGTTLSGRLLHFNLKHNIYRIFDLD